MANADAFVAADGAPSAAAYLVLIQQESWISTHRRVFWPSGLLTREYPHQRMYMQIKGLCFGPEVNSWPSFCTV